MYAYNPTKMVHTINAEKGKRINAPIQRRGILVKLPGEKAGVYDQQKDTNIGLRSVWGYGR